LNKKNYPTYLDPLFLNLALKLRYHRSHFDEFSFDFCDGFTALIVISNVNIRDVRGRRGDSRVLRRRGPSVKDETEGHVSC
jgi:hypothetical protein